MYKLNCLFTILLIPLVVLIDIIIGSNTVIYYIPILFLLPKFRSLIFNKEIKVNFFNELVECLINIYLIFITIKGLNIGYDYFKGSYVNNLYLVNRFMVLIYILIIQNLLYKNLKTSNIDYLVVTDKFFYILGVVISSIFAYFKLKYNISLISLIWIVVLILSSFKLINENNDKYQLLYAAVLASAGIYFSSGILLLPLIRISIIKYSNNSKL